MKTYILDGYNVIHSIPYFERQLDSSLEAARDALVLFCKTYQCARKDVKRIYIVFDGNDQYAGYPSAGSANVVPVFSSSKEEADERIVELLKGFGRKETIVLVSNDNYVGNHARVFGASRMSTQEFFRMAGGRNNSAKKNNRFDSGAIGRAGLTSRKAEEITAEYKRYLGVS